MKKYLSILLVALIALSANASVYDNYIEQWGKLKLVGNQLCSENGEPIQLRGWSTGELHSRYVDGCLGSEQWHLMKSYGANVVRLAMTVDRINHSYYYEIKNGYNTNPEGWKKAIKSYIDQIADEGMYCVLNWHDYDDWSGNSCNKYIKEATDFFKEMSAYCDSKGYKHVLYEICNEPGCKWSNIKEYAEYVIPEILNNQHDAIIIVGTSNNSSSITDPILSPLDSKYKDNVMYSFHYVACDYSYLLENFRTAQKEIPVIVTEFWLSNFNGYLSPCIKNAKKFLADCENTEVAPQLISWMGWAWDRQGDVTSTFEYDLDCSSKNLSKFDMLHKTGKSGEVFVKMLSGELRFDSPEEMIVDTCCTYSAKTQYIPNLKDYPWQWSCYDDWGEGYSYHDTDSISYGNFEGNKILSTVRPNEGVDLCEASLLGTPLANKGYNCLCFVEEGEWINYTVNVAERGYYKVGAYVSNEVEQGELLFYQDRGNITRSLSDLSNNEDYTGVHFDKPYSCADITKSISDDAKWDCWEYKEGLDYEDEPNAVIVFVKEGIQELKVRFNYPAGGIGPLVFTKIEAKIAEEEYCDCGGWTGIGSFHYKTSSGEGVKDENGHEISSNALTTSGHFSISPNPTTGKFTITTPVNGKVHVDVINLSGQIVYSEAFLSSTTIDKRLSTGIYTVVVKSEDGINTQKLVVK